MAEIGQVRSISVHAATSAHSAPTEYVFGVALDENHGLALSLANKPKDPRDRNSPPRLFSERNKSPGFQEKAGAEARRW
jgi:hypothetical protein